jgi:DNA-binding NarL/FixJ family response regulator
LQIVAEASDGLQAVHRVAELDPDLVVLDIGMPVLNGLDAAVQILRSSPRSKVVFLTQEDDTEIQDAALAAGAHGYVLKVDAPRGLVDAIETALCRP